MFQLPRGDEMGMSDKAAGTVAGDAPAMIEVKSADGMASLLNDLFSVPTLSGLQILQECPDASGEDLEHRVPAMQALIDKLGALDLTKVDALVIGARLCVDDDGFELVGGMAGNPKTISGLLLHQHDTLVLAAVEAGDDCAQCAATDRLPKAHNQG
jgi:hypothetical protein